jgi:hypothetical protein
VGIDAASASANCPATAGFKYTYDRFGNRWTETVTAGSGGIQPSYTFDLNNHISGSGILYDAAGNVTNDGVGNTYTYDAENRIVQVNGTPGTDLLPKNRTRPRMTSPNVRRSGWDLQ